MAEERKDGMLDAERGPVITGEAPGESKPMFVPELGDLDDIVLEDGEISEEGHGPAFVILSDLVMGKPKDGQAAQGYSKGRVVRLSHLDATFGTKKANLNQIKTRIKLLMTQGNIRLADEEEASRTEVEVVPEKETNAVREERAKRIEAERQLKELRERHGVPEEADDEVEE